MARKSPLTEVFKGIQETFSVIILRKEPQTDFTPIAYTNSDNQETHNIDVAVSSLPDKTLLSIGEQYREQVVDFIRNHGNMDSLEIPCLYNHRQCSAIVCATPRLFQDDMRVHDVVSILFFMPDGIVAQADYGAYGANAEQQFLNDIAKFQDFTEKPEYKEMVQELSKAFPGINFSDIDEPMFINDEIVEDKLKGETI